MGKFLAIIVTTFGFVTFASAQTEPTSTPVPTVQEDPATYSESTPGKKRPAPATPSFRTESVPKTTNPQSRPSSGRRQSAPSRPADGEDFGKVETNLVTIPVSVFDKNGLYISNLKKEQFRIFEDGKEQKIEYFGTPEKPFTVVLLLDTSPSTEYDIGEIQDAAKAFVNQLKPQDRVMVIEFDGNVNVLTEATGDRPSIYKAIGRADFGDGTSLYEAVSFSLSKRLKAISGRKAIVLFTDGVDTKSSKASYESTVRLADESDTLIFPIYYDTFAATQEDALDVWGPPPGTTAREYELGKKYLEELADYTGGRVFKPESTPGGLTAAFEGIAEELRRQYSIGYIPSEDGRQGERKQIKVRVNQPNLVLRARDSYIVGAK